MIKNEIDNVKVNTLKLEPSKINELTELSQTGYKLYSTNLVDLYNGLHPASLSKLAHIIFNCILYNKMYKKPDAKGYSEDESRRIFTSTLFQPSDLAKRIHPVKYSDGNTDIENDISNILKKLDELEELNIFYMWRFRSPYSYIFVMERDVSSWKYYNPSGYIYPKSLRKIVRLAKSMINTMESLEKQRDRNSTRIEIENSFGEFINKLIGKMNPEISSKLTVWTGNSNIFSYTTSLFGELKNFKDFEGCIYSDLFVSRLPEHIRKKIVRTNKEAVMDRMLLESELVPADDNLVRAKKSRQSKKEIKIKEVEQEKTSNPIKAEIYEVKQSEPFKNPTELTKFYRSFLKTYNCNAKFYMFSDEVILAAEVLDIMSKGGKSDNIKFLKAWVRFYFINTLKGNNIFKEEQTSIRAFGKTFDSYNKNYIGS